MALYRVLRRSWVNARLYEPGAIVEFAGVAGDNLQLLGAAPPPGGGADGPPDGGVRISMLAERVTREQSRRLLASHDAVLGVFREHYRRPEPAPLVVKAGSFTTASAAAPGLGLLTWRGQTLRWRGEPVTWTR